MSFARILVPLDGDPASEVALISALEIARAFDATVYLLEVTRGYGQTLAAATAKGVGSAGSVEAALAIEEAREESASEYLDALQLTLPDVRFVTAVSAGESASVIADYAAAKTIDLIVMATHTRKGLKRLFLGSVTKDVIGRSSVPVLVVHRSED